MSEGIATAVFTPHPARSIHRPVKSLPGKEQTFGDTLDASDAKTAKTGLATTEAADGASSGEVGNGDVKIDDAKADDTSESEKDDVSSDPDDRDATSNRSGDTKAENVFLAWTMTRAGHLTFRLAGHDTPEGKMPNGDADGKLSVPSIPGKGAKTEAAASIADRAGTKTADSAAGARVLAEAGVAPTAQKTAKSNTDKGASPKAETGKGPEGEGMQSRIRLAQQASATAVNGTNAASTDEREVKSPAVEAQKDAGKEKVTFPANGKANQARAHFAGSAESQARTTQVAMQSQAAPDRAPLSGGDRGQGEGDALQGLARASADARPHETTPGPKMNVVSVHSAPAPAAPAHSGSQTGAALAETLGTDPGWKSAASEAAAQTGNAARPDVMHTMKIQLHPANLGIVTAKLRIVGDQLAVELHTESADARHRLSTDSDSMTKALRALGYDVDRVTVHQAPNAHNANAGTQTGGNARQQSFQSHNGNADTNGSGTGHGKGSGHERQDRQQPGSGHGQPDPSRSGLYI